jgi:hypothetical protein
VKQWIETWAGQRGDREGALIGLMDPGAGMTGFSGNNFVYLRSVAHRGGMDYLTEVPPKLSLSDSIESYTERADHVTSVLDEILHHKAPPPQLQG